MKLTITIDIAEDMVPDHKEASKVINRIAADIHQGHSGGFIRNQKTGDESNRWELHVARK